MVREGRRVTFLAYGILRLGRVFFEYCVLGARLLCGRNLFVENVWNRPQASCHFFYFSVVELTPPPWISCLQLIANPIRFEQTDHLVNIDTIS